MAALSRRVATHDDSSDQLYVATIKELQFGELTTKLLRYVSWPRHVTPGSDFNKIAIQGTSRMAADFALSR